MMSEALYWIQRKCSRSLIYLYHGLLTIYYWKKGATVPPITNPLLLKSAKDLAQDIRDGKLKSKDIIQAYIDRIQEVEPYLNAVVQNRFKEALIEATEVDELIQSRVLSKQQLEEDKPLLGVPFTVKAVLKVKGCLCSAGSKFFKDLVSEEDAASVTLLKNAGGIVLATTNISEFSLTFETDNLVHGKTCNPYNSSRSPGGSSGGECALLAAGASAVGIGNDLAGSVRIPAHFNGLYAHKATRGLVPCEGTFPETPIELHKYLSTGPICRFVEDLVMMMKILTADNEEKLKFDQKVDFKKLKIFYFTNMREPRAIPADKETVEVINKAISYFESSYGVTAQELKLLPIVEKITVIIAHIIQEPFKNFVDYLTLGNIKEYSSLREIFKLLTGSPNFSTASMLLFGALSCPLIYKRQNFPYYRELLKQLTEEFDNLLDYNSVIICPTFPQTAPYNGEMKFILSASSCYASLWNFTGMPSTSVPMGLNEDGMPQGLQIIGKTNNDPLTIACAEELHKVFGGWIPPRNG